MNDDARSAEADAGTDLDVGVTADISTVDAADWNRLAGTANPFVRHEFLAALEANRCVCDESGWSPRHLLVYAGGRLAAAAPMYAKYHSYGEFVFDWGWADAYSRAGMEYYPKLVVAAPFTPAMGPRVLVDDGAGLERAGEVLVSAAVEVARQADVSSLHWLFPAPDDADLLERCGLDLRYGYQFHWENPGYADFDDYLAGLTSKRRKSIRRERREAAGAPVEVLVLRGGDIERAQWRAYHALYASTYDRKWGMPSLTPGFFEEVGRTMPDSAMLVLARRGRHYVAGAHFFIGADTLYGRNWGCSEFHPALHFEMCYYRAIEVAIALGLRRFEAGAQGEHKITRGFLPVRTRSAHWVRHDGFRKAVRTFLASERREVDRYIESMHGHTPFRAPALDAALEP